MFLNKAMLKKQIKSSFKWEGLIVGRIYGGLVIAGGHWITWTEDGYIPNWLKAAVMEYTGELPKQEYAFKAKKDEPIQYEIADNDYYDLPGMYKRAVYAYKVTPVIIERGGYDALRVLQQSNTMKMLAIHEDKYKMIDLKELGDENPPSGPASISPNGGILVYKNEHSAYAFTSQTDVQGTEEKIMEHVKIINFSEEGV